MNLPRPLLGVAFMGLTVLVAGAFRRPAPDAQPDPGEQAYLAHCAVCHGAGGAGDGPLADRIRAQGTQPPADLTDAARIASLGKRGVLRVVTAGGAHTGRSAGMPVWGPHLGTRITERIRDHVLELSAPGEAALRARARYLEAPAGTAPGGRRAYVFYCSGCHGSDGKGGGFFAPTLRRSLMPGDLASARLAALTEVELKKCIGLGGAHAANAPTMPGWVNDLAPEVVDELVSYLRGLQAGSVSAPGSARSR